MSDCLSAKAVGRRAAAIDCHTLMDDDGNEVVKGAYLSRGTCKEEGRTALAEKPGSLRAAKSFDFGL